jgi:hypothetical protein
VATSSARQLVAVRVPSLWKVVHAAVLHINISRLCPGYSAVDVSTSFHTRREVNNCRRLQHLALSSPHLFSLALQEYLLPLFRQHRDMITGRCEESSIVDGTNSTRESQNRAQVINYLMQGFAVLVENLAESTCSVTVLLQLRCATSHFLREGLWYTDGPIFLINWAYFLDMAHNQKRLLTYRLSLGKPALVRYLLRWPLATAPVHHRSAFHRK